MPKLAAPKKKISLDNMSIGERIAFFRKKNGLTQKELSEEIGVNRTLIANYELGRAHVYDDTLASIAMALNVSADILLGIKDGINKEKTPSLKITRRLKEIEKLPPNKQKIILRNIDLDLAGLSS